MIKILHSADLHLGARFHSLPPEEARARRQEQLAQLDQLVELCREEGCQMVLLPGDLLDRPQGCREEALALYEAPLEELCSAARQIQLHFCQNRFDLCTPAPLIWRGPGRGMYTSLPGRHWSP